MWMYDAGTTKLTNQDYLFIEDNATIQKILKHCGKWKDAIPRPPPQISAEPASAVEEVTLDYIIDSIGQTDLD
jgi:hypothetical protein